MIKEDFDTSLNFLRTENMPFNRAIDNDMSVSQFNSIFTELEEYLNNLYEKIRVLEEVHEYTLNFIKTSIEERRRAISSDLKVIEMSVDVLNSHDYIAKVINFNDYTDNITDRNGELLPNLICDNQSLTLDSTDIYRKSVSLVSNTGEFTNMEKEVDGDVISAYCRYSDGMNYKLGQLDDNSFRDLLLSFQPMRTEIRYEIFFSEDQGQCNYFDFNPVNCEIVDIKLVDGEDMSTDISRGHFEDQYVGKIVLRVKPINYEISQVLIPDYSCHDYFDVPVSSNRIAEEAILC